MISGEQKLSLVKKDHVTSSVSGRRNGDEILIKLDWHMTIDHVFDSQPYGAVVLVHCPRGTKLLMK